MSAVLDYEGCKRLVNKIVALVSKEVTPIGTIVMWSGSTSQIPTDWALCNGQNGTPDLRGRFILGAGGSYATGATGGSSTHTITVNEMPAHSHTVSVLKEDANATTGGSLFSAGDVDYIQGTESTNSVGGGTAMSIMPPYYALAYIIRVS